MITGIIMHEVWDHSLTHAFAVRTTRGPRVCLVPVRVGMSQYFPTNRYLEEVEVLYAPPRWMSAGEFLRMVEEAGGCP